MRELNPSSSQLTIFIAFEGQKNQSRKNMYIRISNGNMQTRIEFFCTFIILYINKFSKSENNKFQKNTKHDECNSMAHTRGGYDGS